MKRKYAKPISKVRSMHPAPMLNGSVSVNSSDRNSTIRELYLDTESETKVSNSEDVW